MHSGAVHFLKIGSDLPKATVAANWFEHGQIIMVCGRIFRRYRTVAMYRSWQGRMFLKIDTLENPSEEEQALSSGVYFHIPCPSRLTDCGSLVIKPGMHTASSVIRMCRFKILAGQNEGLWTMRRRLLRALSDMYLWFDTAVYELSMSKFEIAPRQDLKALPRTTRPAYTSGEISEQERQVLGRHLTDWRRRAMRTEPLDRSAVEEAVNQLYRAFGLAAPRNVFVQSPLVLAIASSLASALCWKDKHSQVQPDDIVGAFQSIATRDVYASTVESAFRSIEYSIDEETLRTVERLIEQSGEAAQARSFSGAAGTPIDCALVDASSVESSHNLYEQSLSFRSCIPEDIHEAACLAAGRAPSKDMGLLKNRGTTAQRVLQRLSDYCCATATVGEQLVHELCADDKVLRDLMLACLRQSASLLAIGNRQNYDECLTTALTQVLGLDLTAAQDNALWQNLVTKCGATILHQDFCMISDFPQIINLDEQGRPHCQDGPSYVYRDGWSVYHWHGTRVTRQVIERMDSVTVDDIKREANIEVRRIMLDRYGAKRFLLDSGAHEIHRDQCGVLYHQEVHPALEPIVMVKVVNATAEPDGTFKEYYLRVPPNIRTAKEGVAWTFGVGQTDYSPSVQT